MHFRVVCDVIEANLQRSQNFSPFVGRRVHLCQCDLGTKPQRQRGSVALTQLFSLLLERTFRAYHVFSSVSSGAVVAVRVEEAQWRARARVVESIDFLRAVLERHA